MQFWTLLPNVLHDEYGMSHGQQPGFHTLNRRSYRRRPNGVRAQTVYAGHALRPIASKACRLRQTMIRCGRTNSALLAATKATPQHPHGACDSIDPFRCPARRRVPPSSRDSAAPPTAWDAALAFAHHVHSGSVSEVDEISLCEVLGVLAERT